MVDDTKTPILVNAINDAVEYKGCPIFKFKSGS